MLAETSKLELGTVRALFSAASAGVDHSSGFFKPLLAVAADGRSLAVRRAAADPTNGVLVVELVRGVPPTLTG